mgnify:CR=1 FL=1
MDIPRYNETVFSDFENAKVTQSEFIIARIDNHIFIKFPKEKQTFWTPQLHLKINKVDNNSSKIRGLFGPSSKIWTLFICLHVLIAVLFIAFAIWTYINIASNKSYMIPASLTLLMILLWVTLYFAGSIGKASRTKDMRLLYNFMNTVLDIKNQKTP